MPRTRPARETTDYADMLERMVKSYGKRLADADPADLARAVELVATLERTVGEAVVASRRTHGWSWADLARDFGVTRSAVAQRFRKFEA